MLMSTINSRGRSRSPSPNKPLLDENRSVAPLARLEIDDETDDREVVNRPRPGVDDGFFSNGNNNPSRRNGSMPTEEAGDPDVEVIPTRPKEAEDLEPHAPGIGPRLGGDDANPDDPRPPPSSPPVDNPKDHPPPAHQLPNFPLSPGFRQWGWDLETGFTPSGESIPDVNVYQHKKTLAQGMMDLALFSANANQLRYVLETFKFHPYYYPSLSLIAMSLILQVFVGVGLIWNATYNIRDQQALCVANRVNNATTICVFFVTVINVFISAFGVAAAPT